MTKDSEVLITSVSKRFGPAPAVDGVSLRIEAGEFFSILGPSGCGKTTLLRIISGLEFPDEGSVSIGNQDVTNVQAFQRPCNTVFQSYALFPHLSVYQNVAFGLRMRGLPPREIDNRSLEALDMVQIAHLKDRMPRELSGGQQQRVALARAIVNEPKVLLLDEPLGALDLKLRRELQVELTRLKDRVDSTFIYVTHDQEEAFTMSDRIAIMDRGRIVQMGPPREVYAHPLTGYVARFLGLSNIVEGKSTGHGIDASFGHVQLPPGTMAEKGLHMEAVIRPEHLHVEPRRQVASPNEFAGVISDILFAGAETKVVVALTGLEITVIRPSDEVARVALQKQMEVSVRFPPEALSLLERYEAR